VTTSVSNVFFQFTSCFEDTVVVFVSYKYALFAISKYNSLFKWKYINSFNILFKWMYINSFNILFKWMYINSFNILFKWMYINSFNI